MKLQRYNETMILSSENIDVISDKVEGSLSGIGIERQNRLRIRLSIEEILLRFRDRFGEDEKIHVVIGSNFSRPYIQIDLKGEVYNPLNKSDEEIANLSGSLMTALALSPSYTYTYGRNVLRYSLPVQRMNPALKILISILIGVLAGLILGLFSPESASALVGDIFLDPIYDVWSRMLLLISGPVIFLMVITTMLNTSAVSEQGGTTWKIVARYFILSFAMGAIAIITAMLLFDNEFAADVLGINDLADMVGSLNKVIPGSILTPIIKADTPQIILMAFILGGALLILGERVKSVTRLIKECNMVGMLFTEWISRLVPYFSGILIALEIWAGKLGTLTGMYAPFVQSVLISLICVALVILYVCIKKRVGYGLILNKIWPPFRTSLIKGTLDASYGQTEQSCITGLGIEKHYTTVELPQGLVLYMPINVIGTITFTIYAASLTGTEISFVWILVAIVLSVILFVATPPVPGANLLAYIVIFAQLGITGEVLIDAMIFDIVFGIFASAANQSMLQMELVLQASRIGLINDQTLRKPMKRVI